MICNDDLRFEMGRRNPELTGLWFFLLSYKILRKAIGPICDVSKFSLHSDAIVVVTKMGVYGRRSKSRMKYDFNQQ